MHLQQEILPYLNTTKHTTKKRGKRSKLCSRQPSYHLHIPSLEKRDVGTDERGDVGATTRSPFKGKRTSRGIRKKQTEEIADDGLGKRTKVKQSKRKFRHGFKKRINLQCGGDVMEELSPGLYKKSPPFANGQSCFVYKGIYNGQAVAIKSFAGQIPKRVKRYIKNEEKAFRDLDHKNVVKFIGVFGTNIVLEYLEKQVDIEGETHVLHSVDGFLKQIGTKALDDIVVKEG
ncbi:uncharacterized protein LOC118403525 [Branchiostoma floridae]|uniref:Uncharacterized protein LOC118403525 n=1 Tax=Branchiostoma floridae TaxID=7739 RepID=A0A9J7HEI7_BRAFL|nr:uncharacterized protein LOC118403525 [Branchiostoma floridae]